MFETIKRLFDLKRITEVQVNNAVVKEYISEEQKNIILGGSEDVTSI